MFNYGHYSFRDPLCMFSNFTDKLRGMVRLETCAAEYTRFPMRFFIEMGRNVPIIIGHFEGRTE